MSERIHYGNTILKGINKAGTLKPDEGGYYTVVLGALGIDNSVGEHYSNTPLSRATFERNSVLMRRLNQGLLRAEWGHPSPSECPNMMAFERRIRMIKEDRICAHIKEVWLQDIQYDGKVVLGIVGKVRPTGPYGPSLKDMLDNPEENVTFSGRYYSNLSQQGGQTVREIHTVGTWDFVSEPGINVAQKYMSPSLESEGDTVFNLDFLRDAVRAEATHRELAMSMESSGFLAKDLLKGLGVSEKTLKTPASMEW